MDQPKLSRHKGTGRAYVRIRGKAYYLGPWGPNPKKPRPEALQRYHALLAEVAAGGAAVPLARQPADLTIAEGFALYMEFAAKHYTKGGTMHGMIKAAAVPTMDLYGALPVREFGPLKLKAVQYEMVRRGLARTTVNKLVNTVRRMVKWLAANELIPADVFLALKVVDGLRRGRTEAREPEPIQPARIEDVEATLPHLAPPVRAMVRLQLLTGARPGEVLKLRPGDIDTTGDVWTATLAEHKTAHAGKRRVLYFGPKAQAVLKPFLLRDKAAYCFSPKEAVTIRRAETARKIRRRPGQTKTPRRTERVVRDFYGVAEYRRAIARAAKAAGVADWSPNMLRHTAATECRKQYGLDGAQALLGHSHAMITEIYAALDDERVRQIAREIG